MKGLSLAMAFFCACLSSLSADGGSAVIVYAEGDELSIVRDRQEMKVADPMGFVVQAGDIIQTGKGTVVELSIKPKKAVVRVSGNTTLQFRGSYQTGETSLAVLYGRVRAKVEKLVGSERFTVRNEGTVAGVRGTDFGMDVVITKDSELGQSKVEVYSFQGEVAVDTALNASSSIQASGTVNSGEVAEVLVKGEDVSLVTAKMSEDFQRLSTENAFKSDDASAIITPTPEEEKAAKEASAAAAEALPTSVAVIPAQAAPKIDWGPQKRTLGLKNGMLGTSAVLVAAGAGFVIYGAYRKGSGVQDSSSDFLLLAGGISTTTGFMCGLFGLLLNPSIPVP